MPVLNILLLLSDLYTDQGTDVISSLQKRKLKLTGVKLFIQGHTSLDF